MDDKSHVRLVDSHSECNCRYDDVNFLHQESILILRPCLCVKPCVIWESFYPIDIQQFGQLLHLLATETVDDSRLARILLYELYDFPFWIGFVSYFIIEVRPVE